MAYLGYLTQGKCKKETQEKEVSYVKGKRDEKLTEKAKFFMAYVLC